jgi:hypothetical protein
MFQYGKKIQGVQLSSPGHLGYVWALYLRVFNTDGSIKRYAPGCPCDRILAEML